MPCSLNDVLATTELRRRTGRAPNLTAQNAAFHRLSEVLLDPPLEQLGAFLNTALELCSAESAGVSLLERTSDGECFRWIAVAGRYRKHVGGSTPRHESPCGVTLTLGGPQLFVEPARYFACFAEAKPSIAEGLVIPIRGRGGDLGTIWILSHTRNLEFDMEDVRVLTSLAGFSALACSLLGNRKENSGR